MNIIALKRIPGQENFQLKENNNTVVEIRYKPEMHTARVETREEKRVLIFEEESFLKIRLVIKNEYGIRIGSLAWDNFSDTHGAVEIENLKLRFAIQNKSEPELMIYKGREIIYSCRLALSENNIKELRSQVSSSIIAVSWYLYHKIAVQQPAVSIA
jgi:hypothetical protein